MCARLVVKEEVVEPKTWVISDCHFGHANIIQYAARPFRDVQHMNEEMVRRWNEVVGPKDTVYHLGDFCLGPWGKWVPRLVGNKVWVRGNHDKVKQYAGHVGQMHEFLELEVSGKKVLLYHYPLWLRDQWGTWKTYAKDMRDRYEACDVFLYGHTHNNAEPDRPSKARRVCVEDLDYRPVSLEQLIKETYA